MKTLLSKGQKIKSVRSGNILECYNVSQVLVGDKVIRHEYSFADSQKKFKTIKEFDLCVMLEKNWVILK